MASGKRGVGKKAKLKVVEPKIKSAVKRAARVRKASGKIRAKSSVDVARAIRG